METRGDYIRARQSGEQTASVYHQRRLKAVTNGESLLDFMDEAGFVLHVFPDGVFSTDESYCVDMGNVGRESPPVLENRKSGSGRANSLEGTATGTAGQTRSREDGEYYVGRYVHTSINGIIEAVCGKIAYSGGSLDGEKTNGSTWEAMVVSGVRSYIEFLEHEGLSRPFEVHVSLFNMNDVAFDYENRSFPSDARRFSSNNIDPFHASVSAGDTDTEMRDELAPLLDSVWRAAGFNRVPTLGEDGSWKLEDNY